MNLSSKEDADDVFWMRLALREARRARPSPNPPVGSVLVRDGKLLATGFHPRAGEAHAEVVTLDQAEARGGTLYVTLEPCNHFGRTPPCTDRLLKSGLSRVVVAAPDPAPHVRGAVQKLRDAGIEVRVGVMEQAARRLLRPFAKARLTGLPYVTLKAALTLDGRSATRSRDSKWITGIRARRKAHRIRAQHDAVAVGIGTVLADDPALTVRHCQGSQPLRVVFDRSLRLPIASQLVQTARQFPTLVFHESGKPEQIHLLRSRGVLCARFTSLRDALQQLVQKNVLSVLVEGGATILGAMIEEELCDEVAIFLAPKFLADPMALPFAVASGIPTITEAFQLSEVRLRGYGEDLLVAGRVHGLAFADDWPAVP